MAPAPVYTFLVNNIDYQNIYSSPLTNSIETVILSLNNQAVYIPHVGKPLKNGEIFTLYGKKAKQVHDMYIGKLPKIIELIAETHRIPTLIKKDCTFDLSTLPAKASNSKIHIATLFNYSGSTVSLIVSSYNAQGEVAQIELVQDGVPNSLSESFIISIEDSSVSNLTMSGDVNFYYEFSDLSRT